MDRYLTNSDFTKLRKGFETYDNLLCNKTITYIFVHNNKNEKLIIKFNKSNFKHLCGIECDYSPAVLYDRLKRNSVKRQKLMYKNSYTKLKLQILPCLEGLLDLEKVRISLNGSLLRLHYDNLIRSKKMIIALACDKEPHKCSNYPKSLINLTQLNLKQKSFPVIKIEIK